MFTSYYSLQSELNVIRNKLQTHRLLSGVQLPSCSKSNLLPSEVQHTYFAPPQPPAVWDPAGDLRTSLCEGCFLQTWVLRRSVRRYTMWLATWGQDSIDERRLDRFCTVLIQPCAKTLGGPRLAVDLHFVGCEQTAGIQVAKHQFARPFRRNFPAFFSFSSFSVSGAIKQSIDFSSGSKSELNRLRSDITIWSIVAQENSTLQRSFADNSTPVCCEANRRCASKLSCSLVQQIQLRWSELPVSALPTISQILPQYGSVQVQQLAPQFEAKLKENCPCLCRADISNLYYTVPIIHPSTDKYTQNSKSKAFSRAAACDAVARSYEPPFSICSNIVATTGSNFFKTAHVSARLAQRVVQRECEVLAKSSSCKTYSWFCTSLKTPCLLVDHSIKAYSCFIFAKNFWLLHSLSTCLRPPNLVCVQHNGQNKHTIQLFDPRL